MTQGETEIVTNLPLSLSNKLCDCTGTPLACTEGIGWLFSMCASAALFDQTPPCFSDVNVHSMCVREIVVFLAQKYHHLWNKIKLASRKCFYNIKGIFGFLLSEHYFL